MRHACSSIKEVTTAKHRRHPHEDQPWVYFCMLCVPSFFRRHGLFIFTLFLRFKEQLNSHFAPDTSRYREILVDKHDRHSCILFRVHSFRTKRLKFVLARRCSVAYFFVSHWLEGSNYWCLISLSPTPLSLLRPAGCVFRRVLFFDVTASWVYPHFGGPGFTCVYNLVLILFFQGILSSLLVEVWGDLLVFVSFQTLACVSKDRSFVPPEDYRMIIRVAFFSIVGEDA